MKESESERDERGGERVHAARAPLNTPPAPPPGGHFQGITGMQASTNAHELVAKAR